jgi:hypothetical protein
VLSADATVAKGQATGEPWILVTDGGKPRGWIPSDSLGGYPGDTLIGRVPAQPLGHTFTVGTDSLRAALDAAVLSPAGQAVGVDDNGQAVGVATFDQLRAAIQAAERAAESAANRARERAGGADAGAAGVGAGKAGDAGAGDAETAAQAGAQP